MTTPPKMAQLQFIVVTSTLLAKGKNEKLKAMRRKSIAMVSTVLDHRPILHLAGGSGSPRQRLRRTQAMEIMYDDRSEAVPSDIMAWNATVDPMFIRDSRQTMKKLTQRELRGTTKRLSIYTVIMVSGAMIYRASCPHSDATGE